MASNQALSALGHAVSGSVGTAISTATLYPLDLVTTRLKARRHRQDTANYNGIIETFKGIISNEGGAVALYHGLGEDVAKSVVDSFLFFGFYNYMRPRRRRRLRILEELAVGAIAGACAKACTTPISTVVTRKQMSSGDETVREMLSKIRKQSGLMGLWSGYSATLVLTLNPSITFFVNRRLAARIIPALEEEDIPVAWIAFLIAATSKATATAITYPFQTGKTRLQMAGKSTDQETQSVESGCEKQSLARRMLHKIVAILDRTIFGVILHIIKKEGLRALYDGIRGELLKSFFSHGLTMLSKGVIHRLVVRLWYLLAPHPPKRRLRVK